MLQETPATQLEVEIKLEADVDFALPKLAAIAGVTSVEAGDVEELDAVYFDTPDLRLIRSGVTLRRRTGGADEGWHLKLPVRDSDGTARLEVARPLGGSATVVPAALLGLVRSRLRGEQVAPVARINTHRAQHRLLNPDGGKLAVLADDVVLAEAMGPELVVSRWREIEVELDGGDPRLLVDASDLLLAAGARRPGASSKLARALGRRIQLGPVRADQGQVGDPQPDQAQVVALTHLGDQVARLIAEDPQVRLNAPDAVHQMRVAIRRLRSGLATFRPLFGPGCTDSLRAELSWLAGVLGSARDAEVMLAKLRAELDKQPAELIVGPVRRRIDRELTQDYRQAHIAVVQALNSRRYLALLDALEGFVSHPTFATSESAVPPDQVVPSGRRNQAEAEFDREAGGRSGKNQRKRARRAADQELKRALTGLVAKAHKRVLKAARAADTAPSAQARALLLHEVRKAAKRSRYAAEAVKPVLGKPAKSYASKAEAVQEVLGDHRDDAVLRDRLLGLAARAHQATESTFTYGRLHARLERRSELDEDEMQVVWHRLVKRAGHWPGLATG